jgi:hypothetical protein
LFNEASCFIEFAGHLASPSFFIDSTGERRETVSEWAIDKIQLVRELMDDQMIAVIPILSIA